MNTNKIRNFIIQLSASVIDILIKTPLYPHWLEFENMKRGNDELFKFVSGRVLETGSGNCENRERIKKLNKGLHEYIATDFAGWDKLFQSQVKKTNSFKEIGKLLYGKVKDPNKINCVCDALEIPFKSGTFDTYCSFEVLEHIKKPEIFFKEANRVLKKNGKLIISSPFLYREHGGIEIDFQRFTKGGFVCIAQKTGFCVKQLNTYSCFGTTLTILVNQFVVRKLVEGKWFTKIILLPVAPVIFFMMNILGYIIEIVDNDDRFAARYHVVMEKI